MKKICFSLLAIHVRQLDLRHILNDIVRLNSYSLSYIQIWFNGAWCKIYLSQHNYYYTLCWAIEGLTDYLSLSSMMKDWFFLGITVRFWKCWNNLDTFIQNLIFDICLVAMMTWEESYCEFYKTISCKYGL